MGHLARVCALAVLLVGLLVLAGWALESEALTSVWPGLASMKPNTALGFVLAGMGLALRQHHALRLGCAVATIVLGGLSLAQDSSGADFGTDRLLFGETPVAAQGAHPGRMSAITAANFILLGGSLLLLGERGLALRRTAEAMALLAGSAGLLALIGYAYGAEALYQLPGFGSMALHTALAFVLLAVGILCARADGLAGLLASAGVGGQLARRFLPLAIVAPVSLGWLVQLGEEAGLLDATQDSAVLAAALVLVLGSLVWWNAISLETSDNERTQAETKLREREALLRSLTDHARVGMVMLTADHRYVFANSAYAEALGLRVADFIGKRVQDVLAPAQESQVRRRLDRAFAGEERTYEIEMPPRTAEEAKRFFAVTYEPPVQTMRGPCVIVVVVDITERKQAEAALRESEAGERARRAELEALMAAIPAAVFIAHDPACRQVSGNPAAMALLRAPQGRNPFARDPEAGRVHYQVWSNGRRLAAQELPMQRVAATGHAVTGTELDIVFPDGEKRHVMGSALPLFDDAGAVRGSVGAFMDITERARRERNLAFLAGMQKLFAPLSSAADIMRVASERIAQLLELKHCLLVEINDAADTLTVLHDHHAADAASLVGVYRIAEFRTEAERRELAAGRPLVINDLRGDARSAAQVERYAALGMAALVNAPYVTDGRWKFMLSAVRGEPHAWLPEDAELLTELAARIYLRLERARAEAELATSRQRLAGIVESAMDAIVSIGDDQRIVLFNAAAQKMFRCPPAQALGSCVQHFLPERFRAAHRGHVQRYGEIGTTSRAMGWLGEPLTGLRADGEEFPIEASISKIEIGGERLFTVILRDVTERKQASEALRDSEARYREVVESSTIGMAIHQDASGLVYVNPAFLKIFGYASGDALLGCNYHETLAHVEDRPSLLERTAAVYRGEPIAPHPGWRGVKRDGSQIWLSTTASLIRWQGRPAIVSFMTDITERRRVEEEVRLLNRDLEKRVAQRTAELAQQNEDVIRQSREIEQARSALEEQAASLAAASKYKSEFLSNMSHELRTPLNSLLILSRLLADDREHNLTPKQVEFAETMHQSGSDLLRLINEILDLSRIEAGQVNVHVEAVGLAGLREKVVRNFRHVAQSRHLEFSVSLDPALPAAIRSDANRLEQVLKNLLANSFKFTETGSVTLAMRRAAQGWTRPHASLDQAEGVIGFEVTDSGIGIAPEKQQLIFEAFAQADGTTSRKYGGTGLGLSISREIAGLLGGAIGLTSQPGAGSTFTLYLPFAYAPRAVVPKSAATGPRHVEYSHPPSAALSAVADDRAAIYFGDDVLLMVENDPVFAKLLLDIAHHHGFKGLVATSAAAALQLARQHRPTAITLSVTLPDMDGWKLLQCVSDDLGLRHIPVHIVSGEDERPRGLRQGAASFLQKPVSEAALGELFERVRGAKAREHAPLLLIVEDDPATQAQILQALGSGDVIETKLVASAEQGLAELRSKRFDCVVLDLRLPGLSGFEFLEAVRDELRIDDLPIVVYTGLDLSPEQRLRLNRLAESVLLKDARSLDRLLEQASLYLRCPFSALPSPARATLERLHGNAQVLAGAKILVVDDDIRNVYALLAVLDHAKIGAEHADNGRQCLEVLEATPDFDAVLMDIMMPEMDGYETMRRIRKMKGLETLPVIALTAKAMPGDREKCIAAGASDYLAKPVDAEQLLAQLRYWIRR